MLRAYLFLLIAIVAEVISTTLLKKCDGFTRLWPSVGCVIGYVVTFYCLSVSLRTFNVGVAYAIWCGVGIVLISVLAWIFYGERLDLAAWTGMAFIIVGIAIIQLFSKTVAE